MRSVTYAAAIAALTVLPLAAPAAAQDAGAMPLQHADGSSGAGPHGPRPEHDGRKAHADQPSAVDCAQGAAIGYSMPCAATKSDRR